MRKRAEANGFGMVVRHRANCSNQPTRRSGVSSGVGCPATGAMRPSKGWGPGTTALLATGKPARCVSEPSPYLRLSELADTCEALAMYLPSTCTGRSSAACTDQHCNAGKSRAVMSVGLNRSA